MGIVETKDLVFEYIRRDEEGNVEGITRAVDKVNLDIPMRVPAGSYELYHQAVGWRQFSEITEY